jgi:CheY-like chemotaxis protein
MVVVETAMSLQSVLVVDDDVDIREILAEVLGEVGFEVITAANGREALTVARDTSLRPSVILLDLMMPIMDGYGFLEERSVDPVLASIPIAIVTAGHGVDRARIGHGIPIIPKPFETQQLVGVLHHLVSRPANPE